MKYYELCPVTVVVPNTDIVNVQNDCNYLTSIRQIYSIYKTNSINKINENILRYSVKIVLIYSLCV